MALPPPTLTATVSLSVVNSKNHDHIKWIPLVHIREETRNGAQAETSIWKGVETEVSDEYL